jgi:hypothetical protein
MDSREFDGMEAKQSADIGRKGNIYSDFISIKAAYFIIPGRSKIVT